MWILISVLVIFNSKIPQPKDYHVALWCISSDCKYNSLDELYPVEQVVHSDLNFMWYTVYRYQSLEYVKVYRALCEISVDLEIAGESDGIGSQLGVMRERLSYYHKYPNPTKYNFNIPKFMINENKTFASGYVNNLRKRVGSGLEIDREEKLNNAIKEANDIYLFWDAMADVYNESLTFGQRKAALIRIYIFLGEDDFYQGNYPPAAPFWRFVNEN